MGSSELAWNNPPAALTAVPASSAPPPLREGVTGRCCCTDVAHLKAISWVTYGVETQREAARFRILFIFERRVEVEEEIEESTDSDDEDSPSKRAERQRDSESENIENQAEDVERHSDEEGELNESIEKLRKMTEIKDMENQANVEV
ncbi:hypothetical protein CRENBAI_005888 [Crenichthys baileyi]|uniref:Uncharacterized protein n=1 Tax=Crenichthys baileyi TaxID=28760 RepID=A0AAV9RGI2_9TELE